MMELLTLISGAALGAAAISAARARGRGAPPPDAEEGLGDKINWRALVDERGLEDARQAVLENADGLLLCGWRMRGPDLDADTAQGANLLTRQANFAFLPFVDNWIFHAEAIHREAPGYAPEGAFPDRVTRAIDAERRENYLGAGRSYETEHYLFAGWLPPHDVYSRLGEWIVTRPKREDVDAEAQRVLDRFAGYVREFQNRMPSSVRLEPLDADALLTVLHTCVTGKHHPVRTPDDVSDVRRVLLEEGLWGGFQPVVGRRHVRVVGVTDFPLYSQPGLLADLGKLGFPFRFSSRFLPVGSAEALRRIRWQTKGFARKTRPAMQQISGATGAAAKDPRLDFFADQHAIQMAQDSAEAAALASSGAVRFASYTPAVVVMEESEEQADFAAREVVRLLNDKGFTATVEEMNTLDALAGTLPGHGYYNVRKPFIHTKNIANLLPLTSKWPGLRENPCPYYPPGSPPLLWGRTDGCVPVRINWHVSPKDVGHHLIIAPTGMGKSFFLNLMIAQFRRYPGAQVFHLDNGYSGYGLVKAAGGTHYDLCSGRPDAVAFQPLGELDNDAQRAAAARFLDVLFDAQGVQLTPELRDDVNAALLLLAAMDRPERTLTQLYFQLQNDRLRSAVGYYTAEFGNYGRLLDAAHDDLHDGDYQVFELKHLLAFRDDRITAPVLSYLFHGINRRLNGRPTYIPVDEGRMALKKGELAEQIAAWSVTVRKENGVLGLATQDPANLAESPYRAELMESYPVHFFLPNPRMTRDGMEQYRNMGLNDREVEIVRSAQPQRQIYYKTPLGSRLFELAAGPVAHAFLSASDGLSMADTRADVDALVAAHGAAWPAEWLRRRGLGRWAEYVSAAEQEPEVEGAER
jgi:type IV secretion/conjugal transfer VirB4 family ATPase